MGRNDNNTRTGNGASTHGTTSGTEPLAAFILTGKTGSGKSSFIKLLGGRDLEGREPNVSGGIESCTQKTTAYVAMVGGRKIILLDTPGFDDSAVGNIEVLNDIAANLYMFALKQDEIKTQGVIFLHDISETRLSGSQKKTLEVIKAICGPRGMKNCIIGTTMWDTPERTSFNKQVVREGELMRKYWQGILKTTRVPEDNKDAAVGIINDILARPPVLLLIQEEMLIPPHTVENTTAGKILIPEVHAEDKKFREEYEEFKRKTAEDKKKQEEEFNEYKKQSEEKFAKMEEERKSRDEEYQKQNAEKDRLHKEEMRTEREERKKERREDKEERDKEDVKRRKEDQEEQARLKAEWKAEMDELNKKYEEAGKKYKEDTKKAQEKQTKKSEEEEKRKEKVQEELKKSQSSCESRPWWKKALSVAGAIAAAVALTATAPVTVVIAASVAAGTSILQE